MPKNVGDSVAVITGASSGIGRATALRFARAGATVVVAARRRDALESLAAECRALGGRALPFVLDVADQAAVEQLARITHEQFGRIDVWINNAAVTMFARFEDGPIEDYRRVIETNLFGCIYGARAALHYFRDQRSGVLINVASVVGRLTQPYTSAYVITKHAVRALGMCLRQELLLERAADIHVCTVMPASTDTPLFQHAANYTGRRIRPIPPVFSADFVADAIAHVVEHPVRELVVGRRSRALVLQQALAPALTERLMAYMTERRHFETGGVPAASPGNLFEPSAFPAQTSGGWSSPQSAMLRAAAAVALAWVGAWTYWQLRGSPRRF
jgi:NAD(P)-dependent dehydrogenase (short-subunit alcohol dehydrogenase family)